MFDTTTTEEQRPNASLLRLLAVYLNTFDNDSKSQEVQNDLLKWANYMDNHKGDL